MKILRRFILLGLVISLTIMLVTCVSTTFRVEPETSKSGLAIGRIVLIANDFTGRPFSMNGTYSELTGVEVTFINSAGVEITVKSRNGYFYLYSGDETESMRLKRLYYKRTTSEGWRSFESWIGGKTAYIHLKPGTVINVGTIEWTAYQSSISWGVKNVGHQELEEWFRERFYESNWLGANWENNRLFIASPRVRYVWRSEYH